MVYMYDLQYDLQYGSQTPYQLSHVNSIALLKAPPYLEYYKSYRPISQTVFMLSIAINRAEHVCATVIIKHNYMLMCNHKNVINIMLCLLNSTGHI